MLAKINAAENEIEGLKFEAYPTLMFYPRDNKKGIEFLAKPRIRPLQAWLRQYNTGH